MMSGQFIEMALSKGILSDEVVLWMFHSGWFHFNSLSSKSLTYFI